MVDPWTIEYDLDGPCIAGEYGGADVYLNARVSAMGIPTTFEQHVAIEQAPLHLIAAAPTMLDTLQYIELELRQYVGPESIAVSYALDAASSAIAAARGEEVAR